MGWLDKRIPPVIVVALCGLLAWAIAGRWPGPTLPDGVWAAGLWVSALAGVGLCLAGIVEFRRAGTTVDPTRPQDASALVASGIFRFSRNPMYLGFALLLIAWAFRQGSLWALLVVPVCVIYLDRFQIRPEERALRASISAISSALRNSCSPYCSAWACSPPSSGRSSTRSFRST